MRKVWLLTLACLILLCCGCGKEPAETTVPITDASAATQDASPDLGLEYEIFDGQVRILGVTRSEEEIVIPENIEGLPVTAIGEEAFYQNPCRSVILPETLRTIESAAFYRCYYLEEIRIPAAVTEIGSGAFFRTSSLRNIWVAEGNTAYCDLDGVLLSGDKTTLIHYPEGREEATYTIPETVSAIEGLAFGYYPFVRSLVIHPGVTYLHDASLAVITDGLTVIAESGSAAEHFASTHNITCRTGVIPAFLIGRDGGNRISVQMPPSNEINEDQSLLVEDYIRKTLRETTGMVLYLIRSETGITDTERDYTGYCILLEARVICRTKDLVSIAFEGTLDQKDAAHPVSLFLILNYNPETLTQVHFYDLYVVDEALYRAFAEKAENVLLQELGGQWPDGWRGFAEEICSEEQFMKGLQSESDYAWFLTETGVVISYPVPHVLGDQRQVELPYSALSPKNNP